MNRYTALSFRFLFTVVILSSFFTAGAQDGDLVYKDEKHFKNVRQPTFGGDNAEAYFGFDKEHIIFQRTKADEGIECDQIL